MDLDLAQGEEPITNRVHDDGNIAAPDIASTVEPLGSSELAPRNHAPIFGRNSNHTSGELLVGRFVGEHGNDENCQTVA